MQKYLRVKRGGVNEGQMSAAIKVAVSDRLKPRRLKMSRAVSHRDRPFRQSPYVALLLFILILTSTTLQRVAASPLMGFPYDSQNSTSESSTNNSTENSMGISTKNSIENSTNSSMDYSTGISTDNSVNSSMDYSTDISIGNSTNSSMDYSMDSSTDNSTENTNTDVYVIKAVVYEIGILTDTDNTTSSESTERQESVDISLYDAPQEDEFS